MKLNPYGSWRSPITAEMVASAAVRLGSVVVDRADVYFSESRPKEGGRAAILRLDPSGAIDEVLRAPHDARSRVHEYGGGALAAAGGLVVYSNFADQRLYRFEPGHEPEPITPPAPCRYAAHQLDLRRARIVTVVEDHRNGAEPENRLESVALDGGRCWPLARGADFYASPRLSPDGARLAWITWSHPNMPWDGTELWVADLDAEGHARSPQRVAGGPEESIFQPEWGPDGTLFFVSDRSGWWNLYRERRGDVEPLCPMEAEFGLPQWNLEMSTYAPLADGRLLCVAVRGGRARLGLVAPEKKSFEPIDLPYTEYSGVRAFDDRAVFGASSPTMAQRLVTLDTSTLSAREVRQFSSIVLDPAIVSEPEPIEFETTGGTRAHALFYPPKNGAFRAPESERPPVVVKSHGGPTAAASTTLNLRTQYLTSRGIAVLDVDYRGSTGYGRAYRRALDGLWGLADVDDCIAAARFMVAAGRVDGSRLLLTGGSAGGYTTLAALTFHDVFRAGASHYGVSDLEALARDTHKFEARYLDRLVGPYPERRDLYRERSPIHHAEGLSCPVIFLQGLEDKIVPPNQAERMVEILRQKGILVAYVAFEGEQHGFRRAENIQRAIEAELAFFAHVCGFEPFDTIAVPFAART